LREGVGELAGEGVVEVVANQVTVGRSLVDERHRHGTRGAGTSRSEVADGRNVARDETGSSVIDALRKERQDDVEDGIESTTPVPQNLASTPGPTEGGPEFEGRETQVVVPTSVQVGSGTAARKGIIEGPLAGDTRCGVHHSFEGGGSLRHVEGHRKLHGITTRDGDTLGIGDVSVEIVGDGEGVGGDEGGGLVYGFCVRSACGIGKSHSGGVREGFAYVDVDVVETEGVRSGEEETEGIAIAGDLKGAALSAAGAAIAGTGNGEGSAEADRRARGHRNAVSVYETSG